MLAARSPSAAGSSRSQSQRTSQPSDRFDGSFFCGTDNSNPAFSAGEPSVPTNLVRRGLWRITPADVGRSRSSSCSTGHRRDAERAGRCAKLRLFIKDDSAQGEGIIRAAGPCPQAPASEYPASYYSPSASARAQVAWWGRSSRSHSVKAAPERQPSPRSRYTSVWFDLSWKYFRLHYTAPAVSRAISSAFD
jgi:hypothetical protein